MSGPPAPAVMRDSIGLNGDKLKEYTRRYENYISNTKPVRDSLQATLKSMRSSFESGDRAAAREHRDTLRRQADQLSQKDQEFENGLKQLLSADQQKRYSEWEQRQEQARSSRRPHDHRGGRLESGR
jgi:Spy/CpxP family protein refolding chaperone